MPEYPDTITQEQYHRYIADWAALISHGDNEGLRKAFQLPDVARLNFLNFSLDQVVALVTTPNVRSIKARFLLMYDVPDGPRVSLTLFACDTPAKDDLECLSTYYIPTGAAATTIQTVEPSSGPDTEITYREAHRWLTDWVNTEDFTTDIFNTDAGPLQGFNFEVSTFQDPLAAAPPYADKSLFLNLGLIHDPEPTAALFVYIAPLGSRTQGSVEGLARAGAYYDAGQACPPNH